VSDAGTPTISDPGSRLIDAALAAGIRVEPIPGPSAVMAALAASGMPTETFSFLGFPPPRSNARSNWFTRLRQLKGTVVFFEAPHRIERTLADLMEAVGDCEILIGRELTKTHETLVKRPISSVLSDGVKAQGEFTVVVNIGHSTEIAHHESPSAATLLHEFCDMTNNKLVVRREAIRQLAKRHGLTPNAVYKAIEAGRKSVD
jgi:16S rRNA (cytidine1402-2'-O)-methyltransferase